MLYLYDDTCPIQQINNRFCFVSIIVVVEMLRLKCIIMPAQVVQRQEILLLCGTVCEYCVYYTHRYEAALYYA